VRFLDVAHLVIEEIRRGRPDFEPGIVTRFVETTQVAPTVLEAPGLDPGSLDAVRIEGTPVLLD